MRRILAVLVVLACALAVSACGEDEGPGETKSDADPKIIKIRFADGDVTPNGERIGVEVGQPIDLVIVSDEAGELHVHSDPEQTLEYDEGETVHQLQIDRPGVVEVETHDPDRIVVQLEVK